MMKYLTILPILLYIAYVWEYYGIQKSISDSYYKVSKVGKWLFVASLVLTSLLLAGTQIYYSEQIGFKEIVIFFAALGICYTAAAAKFKLNSIVNTWHVSGAIGGYVLGYLYVVLVHGWNSIFPISFSLWLIYVNHRIQLLKDKKSNYKEGVYINKSVWWDEIIGLLTIYYSTI